jgi:cell division protein FtsA
MDDSIKILGAGISKSGGIKKGIITNIDQASRSIKRAVGDAKKVSGTHYDDVIVSISGAYAKSVDSYGVVNAPNKEIGLNEIKRVLEMADHNANIPTEYERLHVLPYNFKVDEHDSIDDPLGMNGTRLEVNVHIITVLKSSLNNLKKAIKSASIEAKNIVLSGYASSISVLNDDERELGVAVIDIGGATTDIVVHKGHSIRYNEFIGVGSSNITNDLSMALHTPLISAEEIKIKYGSLLNQDSGVIKIPSIGDENISNDASLDTIKNVILARTQETLVIVSNYLKESKYLDKLGAGIVLTGGLTKIEGIRELAISIFGNVPVRVAKPAENSISGMFDTLKSSEYATTIGLILYGAGISTSYEMDSNRQLRAYEEPSSNHISQGDESIYEDDDRLSLDIAHKDQSDNNTFEVILEPEQKRGVISRFFNRILNIF